MAIVALDIATHMGWALLDEDRPEKPFLGSVRFPSDPDEVGRAALNLFQFLDERHRMHGGITHIVFEAQHVAGTKKRSLPDGSMVETGGMNMRTLERLLGLAGVTELYAAMIRARCYKVHISTWRKHAFGTGRLNRQEAKARAMEECRRLGFDPLNDNEAEAFFILDYFLHLQNSVGGRKFAMPWRDNAFFNNKGGQR